MAIIVLIKKKKQVLEVHVFIFVLKLLAISHQDNRCIAGRNPFTGTLAIREEPGELEQHCLLPGTEIKLNLEILTRGPLSCIMNHPKFIISKQTEEPIKYKKGF